MIRGWGPKGYRDFLARVDSRIDMDYREMAHPWKPEFRGYQASYQPKPKHWRRNQAANKATAAAKRLLKEWRESDD